VTGNRADQADSEAVSAAGRAAGTTYRRTNVQGRATSCRCSRANVAQALRQPPRDRRGQAAGDPARMTCGTLTPRCCWRRVSRSRWSASASARQHDDHAAGVRARDAGQPARRRGAVRLAGRREGKHNEEPEHQSGITGPFLAGRVPLSPAPMLCPRSESPLTYMPAITGELVLGGYQ
jgi:hypothetical protein